MKKEIYMEVLIRSFKEMNVSLLDGFCYGLDCKEVLELDSLIRTAMRNLDSYGEDVTRYYALLKVTKKHFERTLHK